MFFKKIKALFVFTAIFLLLVSCNITNTSEAHFETKFTGEDNLSDYLVGKIKKAEENIRVMIFIFEWEPIADALIAASQRGVQVEVITDIRTTNLTSEPSKEKSIPNYLFENGIDIYIYDDRPFIMHHKVIFIDNFLFIGSYNFQKSATIKNRENLLLIENNEIYEKYIQEYNRVKAKSFLLTKEQSIDNSNTYSLGHIWISYRYIIVTCFALSLSLNVFFYFYCRNFFKGIFVNYVKVLRRFFRSTRN